MFIATAEASDEEMAERIRHHQSERESYFEVIEAPLDIATALREIPSSRLVIVDCLTIWLNNILFNKIKPNFQEIISAAKSRLGDTVFVTNEVGEGIVPMHPVSREFRDLSGQMNQFFAQHCDEVFYIKFGIGLKIK